VTYNRITSAGEVKIISNTMHRKCRLVSTLYFDVSTMCLTAAGIAVIAEACKLKLS
jgi:hypothetical protein